MTNKCPMCNTDESEHTEVLRVLKPFYEAHEHALALAAVDPVGEAAGVLSRNGYMTECILGAADLYRKLKTQ